MSDGERFEMRLDRFAAAAGTKVRGEGELAGRVSGIRTN